MNVTFPLGEQLGRGFCGRELGERLLCLRGVPGWVGSPKRVASIKPCLLINIPPQVCMLLQSIKQGGVLPFEVPYAPVQNN